MGERVIVDVGIGAVRAGEFADGRGDVVLPCGDGRVCVPGRNALQQALVAFDESHVVGAVVGDAEQADERCRIARALFEHRADTWQPAKAQHGVLEGEVGLEHRLRVGLHGDIAHPRQEVDRFGEA